MPPSTIPVSAKADETDGARVGTVNYDFGGDITGAIEKFGEDVIFANFVAQAKINLQSALRRWMNPKEGEPTPSDADLQASAEKWTPSNRTVTRRDTVTKVADMFKLLSAEQRQQLMALMTEPE